MIRVLAWLCTVAAAILASSPDPSSGRILGATLFVLAGTAALAFPVAMTAHTVLGMGLAGSLILSGQAWPLVLSVASGTILAAELLGVYWTESLPLQRERPRPTGRPVQAVVVGSVAYGIVLFGASLPGPSGVGAVVLAALAIVGAAAFLYEPSPASWFSRNPR